MKANQADMWILVDPVDSNEAPYLYNKNTEETRPLKRQYLAQVKYKGYSPDEWCNVGFHFTGSRYLPTRREALECIEKAKHEYVSGQNQNTSCSGLGIEIVVDSKTVEMFTVVDTRIRCRIVSYWEDVE